MRYKAEQTAAYICPKCWTKITVDTAKRVPSLFCRNCLKSRQLTMLRLILPRDRETVSQTKDIF